MLPITSIDQILDFMGLYNNYISLGVRGSIIDAVHKKFATLVLRRSLRVLPKYTHSAEDLGVK